MNSRTLRVLMASLIMVMSSLAGCLGGTLEEVSDQDQEYLGKVIASTYHVEQLLSAVGGDLIEVELLSPTNTPVHDYEPTATDILRLQDADVFFYHGLGLEPWVESTLTGLSVAAPTSVSTHAMPSGETALDYESLLVGELCEHLNEGPFENATLVMDRESMTELHAEHVTYNMSFPVMDDDHDEHGEEDHDEHGEEDHDEHGEEDHDEHDAHEGHGHASPMETITNPNGCPTDFVIVIYELEKGEVVLEFEDEDGHDFDMVVLKMGGGHAHHHHDEEHGDDDHDEITQEDCERRNGTWEEIPDRVGEFHCDFEHNEHDEHDDDHDDEMTPEMALQSFDSNNDSHISWDEFRVAWTSEDHDDHGDDRHDNETHDEHNAMEEAMEEYMLDLLYVGFNESDADNNTLLNMTELHHFIETIEDIEDDMESVSTQIMISAFDDDEDGKLSLSEFTSMMETMNNGSEGHNETGSHNGTGSHNETQMMGMMFGMYDANTDGFINASELNMLMEMGDDDHGIIGLTTLHVEEEGQYGFLLPSDVTMHVLNSRDAHEGHGHDDHDGDDDRDHEDHSGDGDNDRDHDDHEGDDHDDHDDHSEEEIPFDPHSWLDPLAFKAQIDVVLNAFIIAFPSGADTFTANADNYKLELDALANGFDEAFGEGGTCNNVDKRVVANHNAYSYLAQRYDIEFVAVHGVDPEGEPTAENIAEVIETISEDEITVFFVEEYTDLSSVEAIQSQTGVTILYLYTMELAPSTDGEDYLSLMQKNLDNLVTGICASIPNGR